jgi:transposase-like protein
LYYRKTKTFEFIIDETIIKVGSEYIWLWIAIENDNRDILQISIFKERNMLFVAAERFISNLVKRYGEYTSCFSKWRYMVSTGLQVLETATSSHPFFI